MPELAYEKCWCCGTWHTIHRHSLSVNNSGALYCPQCGKSLVQWSGEYFYTLALPDKPPALLTLLGDEPQPQDRPQRPK